MEHSPLQHFLEVKAIIRQGKLQALQAVNVQLIQINWQVGAYLSTRLTTAAYGDKIVDQLAKWLQAEEPALKGFDKRSLYRMKAFFEQWNSLDSSLLPPAMKENYIFPKPDFSGSEIVGSVTPLSDPLPDFLTKLSWTHHVEI